MKIPIYSYLLTFSLLNPLLANDSELEVRNQLLRDTLGYSEKQFADYQKAQEEREIRFSNISSEKKAAFRKGMEASKIAIHKGEYANAYVILLATNEVYSESAVVNNYLGSVLLDFRDFDRANFYYGKAVEIVPFNSVYRYNYGESFFAMRKYASALEEMQVVEKLTVSNNALHDLAIMKQYLCYIALSEEGRDVSKELDAIRAQSQTNRLNPLFYYTKAVDFYRSDDTKNAQKWRRYARYVKGNSNELLAWEDALIEFGLMPSIYGGEEVSEKIENLEK